MTARHRFRPASGAALALLLAFVANAAAQPALPEGAVARIGTPRLRLPGSVINVVFAPHAS